MKKFRTVRFGELEYDEKDVIHLPGGLIGMPNLQRWLMLDMEAGVPLKWLQSLDRNDFGFPVTEPAFFCDPYEFESPARVRQVTDAGSPAELVTLIITTIQAGGEKITGNLLAPLVIGSESRKGLQLTLDNGNWSSRQEIDYLKFGLAVQSPEEENTEPDTAEPGVEQTDTADGEPQEASL
ncbi:MAG: flagellar assembly protein FliW [bacterium]